MRERDEYKKQGANASKMFLAKSDLKEVKELYGESAFLFSKIIKQNLPFNKKIKILDLGSFRGEFLEQIMDYLEKDKFYGIAVDINDEALKENKIAERKVLSNLTNLKMEDKSVDLAIMRYALHWNSLKNQEKIIIEIARVTKKFAIIQHVGADNKYPEEYRKKINLIFGGSIPSLKRKNSFWSSQTEVENIFNSLNIKYTLVEQKKISKLSNLFKEKFKLSADDGKKVKEILEDKDYVVRTTWLLKFN